MFYVGLDLGARRDNSAIAVVEKEEGSRLYLSSTPVPLLLRHVERIPLGTPYPAVVELGRETVGDQELRGRVAVVADATGVGAPVIDMLRAARLGCEVTAVTITGGERATSRGQDWNVPKRDLIAGLQVLLERGELRIACGMRDAGALVQELIDVRTKVRGSGRIRYGADACGEHDDLVIAVALGCWRGRRRENGFGSTPFPGM